jgi:hypothetical protein
LILFFRDNCNYKSTSKAAGEGARPTRPLVLKLVFRYCRGA